MGFDRRQLPTLEAECVIFLEAVKKPAEYSRELFRYQSPERLISEIYCQKRGELHWLPPNLAFS